MKKTKANVGGVVVLERGCEGDRRVLGEESRHDEQGREGGDEEGGSEEVDEDEGKGDGRDGG